MKYYKKQQLSLGILLHVPKISASKNDSETEN